MASTFEFIVVTPERQIREGPAEMIVVRGAEGDLGILPRHIPLVTPIKPSVLEVRAPGGRERYAITGGFLEVRGDQVNVLARTAERPDEIDAGRAEAARKRAEERLEEHRADLDIVRAELALQRAVVRLQVAEEARKSTV